MEIGRVVRAAGLPDSISPGRTATVEVTIEPPLVGQYVTFEIVSLSENSGSATIADVPQLSATGTIEIRGGDQSSPGDGNELKIVANLDGEPIAESPPFKVCAHPVAVAYEYIGEFGDDPNRYGILLNVTIVSDSQNNADLDLVLEKEIVSADFGHSDLLHDCAPELPEQDQTFHPAIAAVFTDKHTVGRVTTRAKDHHRLHGQQGSWCNDQLDVFVCQRCGIAEPGILIPKSGYRLTRTIFTQDGQLKVAFLKEPFATAIEGIQAEPGPSPSIEQVVDALPLLEPLPPLGNSNESDEAG